VILYRERSADRLRPVCHDLESNSACVIQGLRHAETVVGNTELERATGASRGDSDLGGLPVAPRVCKCLLDDSVQILNSRFRQFIFTPVITDTGDSYTVGRGDFRGEPRKSSGQAPGFNGWSCQAVGDQPGGSDCPADEREHLINAIGIWVVALAQSICDRPERILDAGQLLTQPIVQIVADPTSFALGGLAQSKLEQLSGAGVLARTRNFKHLPGRIAFDDAAAIVEP
jgi:hypothetical protein